jgi:hypothetical protein
VKKESPKEKRDRLFKQSRPHFRKADLINLDGTYGQDMGILWAAYKAGSFVAPEGMTQEQFGGWVISQARRFTSLWLGEDANKAFKSGRGIVGLVGTNNDGMLVTAEGQVFKWATKRNLLRLCVGFLHMITKSRGTGVCMVKGDKASQPLLDKMNGYGLLYYIGKTNPDEYLYSVRGRGSD